MTKLILETLGDMRTGLAARDQGDTPIPDGSVLIAMEAAPINPVDSLFSNGWYVVQPHLPAAVGGEGVGRVIGVGTTGRSDLLGRRVIVVPTYETGLWADRVSVPASDVVVVPDEIDVLQASMLGINPMTAHLLLTQYVDLDNGDWIGQNLGSSAVGRLVIALARRAGVRTVSIVRSESAAATVRRLGGDIAIIDGTDLTARIKEALHGEQLRLVLDGAGGSTPGALAQALEPGGTIVTYSALDGASPILPLADLVFRNVSHRGFWVGNWAHEASPTVLAQTYEQLAQMIRDGIIHIPIDSTFPAQQFGEALERALSGDAHGKVILTFNG